MEVKKRDVFNYSWAVNRTVVNFDWKFGQKLFNFQSFSVWFNYFSVDWLFALWSTKINLNHRSTIVSTTVVPKLKYKISYFNIKIVSFKIVKRVFIFCCLGVLRLRGEIAKLQYGFSVPFKNGKKYENNTEACPPPAHLPDIISVSILYRDVYYSVLNWECGCQKRIKMKLTEKGTFVNGKWSLHGW